MFGITTIRSTPAPSIPTFGGSAKSSDRQPDTWIRFVEWVTAWSSGPRPVWLSVPPQVSFWLSAQFAFWNRGGDSLSPRALEEDQDRRRIKTERGDKLSPPRSDMLGFGW